MEILAPRRKEGDFPDGTGRRPPLNPAQPILYHDAGRYVVVSKPADVRMDGDFTHTVEKLISSAINVDKVSGLRFVQRLDYATSGVLIAALQKRYAYFAGHQFEHRTVDKRYTALLHGTPADLAEWTWRIGYEHPDSFRMKAFPVDAEEGRASVTKVRVLKRGVYHGTKVSLVELIPHSGRRHQLRVHAKEAGFPIVGDATYALDEGLFGADNNNNNTSFLPPRMMLHAQSLKIRLPEKGTEVKGKKSAFKQLVEMKFCTPCPFEQLDGVAWTPSADEKTSLEELKQTPA